MTILLYAYNRTQRIEYPDAQMAKDIEHAVYRDCHADHLFGYGARLVSDEQTWDAMDALVAKYDHQDKSIRKLSAFAKKVPAGKIFYCLNADKAGFPERRVAMSCIEAEEAGYPFLPVHNQLYHTGSMLGVEFDYYAYGFDDIEYRIGHADLNQRVCRFCGKTGREHFQKDAHAIPEALGNKNLYCHDECDDCNEGLSKIENNLTYFMDVRRAFLKIPHKGNSKTPVIYGANFAIHPDANDVPQLYLSREDIPEGVDITKPFHHRLNHRNVITNEGIYKALSKIIVDLADESRLPQFKNTVEWINGKILPDTLPSVWMGFLSTIYQQPVIDIYYSKDGSKPYCTAILFTGDIAYLFVVPQVVADGGRYKTDASLKSHFDRFKSMIAAHWEEQNTSDYRKATPWVELDIDPSAPNLHIVSKSDIHLQAPKRPNYTPQHDVQFAPFDMNDVKCIGVERADFKVRWTQAVSEQEKHDVSMNTTRRGFVLEPDKGQILAEVEGSFANSDNSIEYCSFDVQVRLQLTDFSKYIELVYGVDGGLETFAIDYHLRDNMIVHLLASGELALRPKRAGTPYENFDLRQLYDERINAQYWYNIPAHSLQGGRFVVCDEELRGR